MNRGSEGEHERKRRSDIESFWTICPYCYYLYEYEIMYLDCWLRCQNCEKAFHGVAIEGPLPKIRAVDGKELYSVRLGLFEICYSFEDYGTDQIQDVVDVDAGGSNIHRRRVIANHEAKSGDMNTNEDDHLKEKFGTNDSELKSGELEFYFDDDDIYVGLADLI